MQYQLEGGGALNVQTVWILAPEFPWQEVSKVPRQENNLLRNIYEKGHPDNIEGGSDRAGSGNREISQV